MRWEHAAPGVSFFKGARGISPRVAVLHVCLKRARGMTRLPLATRGKSYQVLEYSETLRSQYFTATGNDSHRFVFFGTLYFKLVETSLHHNRLYNISDFFYIIYFVFCHHNFATSATAHFARKGVISASLFCSYTRVNWNIFRKLSWMLCQPAVIKPRCIF